MYHITQLNALLEVWYKIIRICNNILKKIYAIKEVNHLISTDQIEMEFIEATDKPNNNGSIYDQRKRVCFLAQGHPVTEAGFPSALSSGS